MNNKLILFGIRVTMSFQTKAQNLIARLRSGAVKFYITLISAYKACVNDDSFFILDEAFETPNTFIKRLHIIGGGEQLDSSNTRGNTNIIL